MSLCVCVCLFPNSSETANPSELKFSGMIPLGNEKVLGLKTSGFVEPLAGKKMELERVRACSVYNRLGLTLDVSEGERDSKREINIHAHPQVYEVLP